MNRAILRQNSLAQLATLASKTNTSTEVPVFILGPYVPDSTLKLLESVRDALRSRYGYAAFLENEFSLGVGLRDTCRELFELSRFALFIVTNEGIDRGWQFELADLAGLPNSPLDKIGFYYESQAKLQGPVKEFLGSHQIRHLEIVRPGNPERTIDGLIQMVNTYLLQFSK
jgi:hypothetical protein